MAASMKVLGSRGEWMENRVRIGGSEAASILGLNPWKSNVELWLEKTGQKEREDISDKPVVKYGTEAEQHLRELFKLDYPQYAVDYVEHNLWLNERYPFAHASLDGELTDGDGRRGVLEIKTTNIFNPSQWRKWDGKVPDNYYCQLLWYMAVTEFEFAVLKAQIKTCYGGDVRLETRHYFIERADVEDDISHIMAEGERFWQSIQSGRKPDLILPEI